MANYFSLFLVVVSAITGLVWLVYVWAFAPKKSPTLNKEQNKAIYEEQIPNGVDFCRQLFPIFFGVMIFRSFIYEPFQIPSGSMFPTLLVGDFLLVEKFAYSLKEPVGRNEIIKTGDVKRGDVIVFKYPEDEKLDYIKRVIGLPGDTVLYQDKQVFITPACKDQSPCPQQIKVELNYVGKGNAQEHGDVAPIYSEQLGNVEHKILRNPANRDLRRQRFVVPEGEYFVLGDNRDNSQDSRYWGSVPEENIVGKAVVIWMSFEFGRTEKDTLPTFVPTGVRFGRIGGIE